jgi:hypothetical protein
MLYKRKKEKLKMQSNFRHQQFNTIAKQGGVMPSYWLTINAGSLSLDRTPEITRVREDMM